MIPNDTLATLQIILFHPYQYTLLPVSPRPSFLPLQGLINSSNQKQHQATYKTPHRVERITKEREPQFPDLSGWANLIANSDL